ncbi:MAG: hypothetical protein AB1631_29780 [Acidobacteriota bacterium]
MTADLRVEVIRSDNLAQFQSIFDEVAEKAMTVVTDAVIGEAQALSPVYRGTFKSSLVSDIQKPSPFLIEGFIQSPLNYAPVIEGVDEAGNETPYGRRPGARMPPFNELRQWVVRVLVPQIQSNAAALLRQAGIRRRRKGTKEEADSRIQQAIDNLTWLVGRAISSRGLPRQGYEHFRPVGRAAKALEQLVMEIMTEQVPAEVEKRL